MNITIPSSETNYPLPFLSSPLFPVLYFSLFYAQKHSPRITKRTHIWPTYDYIIVGAGSAGATLAARLSEIPFVTVLLLEAGKSPPVMTEMMIVARSFYGSDIDWGYFTTPQKNTGRLLNDHRFLYPRGKTLGGCSTVNAGLYVRGNRYDYDKWSEEGAVGWSYLDVLPYFKKMEMNMNPESIDIPYHGFEGPITVENGRFESPYKSAVRVAIQELGHHQVDPNGQFQKGFYDYQMTTRNGQRCNTAKGYLVPAENRTNLHIVDNAFVTKVIFIGNRAVAVQVVFNNEDKHRTIFTSREIILSAGAINTPHILMLSGVGPKEHLEEMKIPIVADLPVGLSLQDHVGSFLMYYTDKLPSAFEDITNPQNIEQYISSRTGPLAASPSSHQYTAFLTNEKYTTEDAIPDYQLYISHIIASGIATQINLRRDVQDRVFKPYESVSTLRCMSHVLHPKSTGFVKLQSSNPFEYPIIEPNYLAHPQDLIDIVEGLKECDRIFNTSAFRSMGMKPIERKYPGCEIYNRYSENYLVCVAKSIAVTIYHPTSTAKMGNIHDPTTVVDSQLKVKGLHGLRVVDASVMPTVPSGNTNVPTIMIAEKAADIIKEEIA